MTKQDAQIYETDHNVTNKGLPVSKNEMNLQLD